MVIAPASWADWLNPGNNDKELMREVMRHATLIGGERPGVAPRLDVR